MSGRSACRSSRSRVITVMAGLVFSVVAGTSARADLATVHLKDGKSVTVEMLFADRGQIRWRPASGAGQESSFLRSQVEHVDFPSTPAWREAEALFESGKFGQAIGKYRIVIADPVNHYYPFPGNYVSLAQERLLRCFRQQMDLASIAKQAQVVRDERLNLPPSMREPDPINEAWRALAEQSWEKMLSALESSKTKSPEYFYLRGRAFEGLGKTEEAIQEYAGVYTLNFGGTTRLTRESLQRSAALLSRLGNTDREPELVAQLKLYRDLFGKGELWEGASPDLAKLADGEIQTLGEATGDMAELPDGGGSEAGAVVESSGTMATLPAADQRDYILASEIDQRFFVVGGEGTEEVKPAPDKGVREEPEGYVLDGTSGIRIGQVDGSAPVTLLRVRFRPTAPDGIVVDLNEGKKGGFGLYLEKGELKFVWAPKGRNRIDQWNLGSIETNRFTNVFVHVWNDGTIKAQVDREEKTFETSKEGLKLSENLVAAVGFAGAGGSAGGTASGKDSIPFQGTISHFSIGNGASLVEIEEREVKRFGKRVLLLPPVQSAPAAAPPAPAGDPAQKKAAPAQKKAAPAQKKAAPADAKGAEKAKAKAKEAPAKG